MSSMNFSHFLEESFINLFKNDKSGREKYVDEVWNILQASYAAIGGIHGKGFSSKEEMIEELEFWKLVKKSNKLVAVAIYKDKGGRKLVAIGGDGSDEAKKWILDILKNDLLLLRSYSEISGPLLSFLKKNVGTDLLKSFVKSVADVKKILPNDEILEVDRNDPELKKHPELADFFYQRDIGGDLHTKIMLGTHGNQIHQMSIEPSLKKSFL